MSVTTDDMIAQAIKNGGDRRKTEPRYSGADIAGVGFLACTIEWQVCHGKRSHWRSRWVLNERRGYTWRLTRREAETQLEKGATMRLPRATPAPQEGE